MFLACEHYINVVKIWRDIEEVSKIALIYYFNLVIEYVKYCRVQVRGLDMLTKMGNNLLFFFVKILPKFGDKFKTLKLVRIDDQL